MTKIIGAPTLDDAADALTEEVQRAETRGERTLVFCEDRLTLLAERAVLGERGATFLTEVTTFRRFLGTCPLGQQKTVTKQGSVLAVAAILDAQKEKLRCFGRNAAQAVYETIAQLSASRVTEDMLLRGAEAAGGMLAAKLRDLALVLHEYRAFLDSRGLYDENGYLALLPACIRDRLEGVHVLFFAFPSFTRQARQGIRAAIETARSVTGIFLAGNAAFYTNEAARIFRLTAEEFGPVERVLRKTTLCREAAALRKSLFALDLPREAIGTTHVCTFTPMDEFEEMNTVAACIKKFVAEGRRYREIAVLVGGSDHFSAVEKAMRAYRIPYYADIKRKFSEHPFCGFVLDVLDAVSDGVLPDEADAVASSVYFGESGNYRNYLLRYGVYRGAALREIREEAFEEYGGREALVRCRDRMIAVVGCFKRRAKAEGREYTAAIRNLREVVGEAQVTEALAKKLPEEERATLDLSRLDGVLDEMDRIIGGQTFSTREFARLLKSALDALTVSILPQRADAVFVGDITESKICRAPVLFCAGLTDGLPRVSQDTAVITDGEIEKLSRLDVEIDPAIAVVNARAREAYALNLCAFSEQLILSCPKCENGVEVTRSEIFDSVEKTFSMAPMPEVYPYDCSEFGPAMLNFFRDLDAFYAEKSDTASSELVARVSSLRALLRAPVRDDWMPSDPELLRQRREKPQTPEAGELWLRRDISPTRLEEYFVCPYKGFALKALRISDREERTLFDAADAGSFVHTVLERVARDFNAIPDETACRLRAEEEARALLEEPRFRVADTPAGAYLGARLIGEAAAVTVVAYRQLAASAYRVSAAEQEIALPVLHMKGKADRIDESGGFVRVIDYKTGGIEDDPVAYYTGRKLQLELYLRAAAEGKLAAGAFYFPAADEFVNEDADGKFRMRGYFCKDPEVVAGMDPACEAGKKSEIFDSGSRKALPRADFEDFLDYAFLVSAQAEREMREGNIAPSPYDDACRYCKLKGMCGFTGRPRKEQAVRCGEIVDIVRDAEEARHE